MSFATVINCMDGRTQLPVITFLMNRFNIMYVDSITEPGPIALLSNAPASQETKNIYKRINISVEKHKS
ncbi:MAG: carbonic anhydrase, partial [bacterium]